MSAAENMASLRTWLAETLAEIKFGSWRKFWYFETNCVHSSNEQQKAQTILQNKPFQEVYAHKCKSQNWKTAPLIGAVLFKIFKDKSWLKKTTLFHFKMLFWSLNGNIVIFLVAKFITTGIS